MRHLTLALDIDGTLIDTRESFDAVVKAVSGVHDDAAIRAFRDTGGFIDDWELSRALRAWDAAGRPKIVERCSNLDDVLAWCSNDPGDLSHACHRLYLGGDEPTDDGLWRKERVIVDGARLTRLAAHPHIDVVCCTGRDRTEMRCAEQLLGYHFERITTMEQAKKPDPQALLRLVTQPTDVIVLVGDTHADRLTVTHAQRAKPEALLGFVFVTYQRTAAQLVDALIDSDDPASIALSLCES